MYRRRYSKIFKSFSYKQPSIPRFNNTSYRTDNATTLVHEYLHTSFLSIVNPGICREMFMNNAILYISFSGKIHTEFSKQEGFVPQVFFLTIFLMFFLLCIYFSFSHCRTLDAKKRLAEFRKETEIPFCGSANLDSCFYLKDFVKQGLGNVPTDIFSGRKGCIPGKASSMR
jgi:hypothetical protein